MNAWRAPQRILVRHRPNQIADLGGDRRSPGVSATPPSPEQADALAMPGDDGRRLHDDECPAPLLPAADSLAQSHRLALASRNRRGRDRSSTCS